MRDNTPRPVGEFGDLEALDREIEKLKEEEVSETEWPVYDEAKGG